MIRITRQQFRSVRFNSYQIKSSSFLKYNNLNVPIVISFRDILCYRYYLFPSHYNFYEFEVEGRLNTSEVHFFQDLDDIQKLVRLPINVDCPACDTSNRNTDPVVYCSNCERGFLT